jgi:poly-gamma-glutamate capsule biosynthesis protein CapA/YwtB (metallophosphatase superfamily)
MFKYTSRHFHESDFSIGVYEGPSAGNNTSFSNSNYDDGIPIALNYPDEFAEAVKKAGIDLVTTANNHLLDKGINGAIRTLNILDKYNLKHLGSYRNQEEKNKIKILNIKGVNIAFLAYTSFVNKMKCENLYKNFKYLTGIIPYRNIISHKIKI